MQVIGFDIGGTKSAVLVAEATEEGVVFSGRSEIPTDGSWPGMLEKLCVLGEELARQSGIRIQDCVAGVSCGGPLSSDRRSICSPPNLPGWDDVPVVQFLEQRLGITAFLENDADACALAEWQYGAGKGCKSMIFLTFGTGLGAGLILDGRLYRGASGMAGEVGHIRMEPDGPEGYGKRGSLEGFCSGGGISRLALERRPEQKHMTARELAEAARGGDAFARGIYAESGREFGRGLAILIDLLNPEMIVAGSIYARSGDLLAQEMYEEIAKEALPSSGKACQIRAAVLGEQIGDYGAVMAAVYGMKRNKI